MTLRETYVTQVEIENYCSTYISFHVRFYGKEILVRKVNNEFCLFFMSMLLIIKSFLPLTIILIFIRPLSIFSTFYFHVRLLLVRLEGKISTFTQNNFPLSPLASIFWGKTFQITAAFPLACFIAVPLKWTLATSLNSFLGTVFARRP